MRAEFIAQPRLDLGRRDTKSPVVRHPDQWQRLFLEERRKPVYPWPHWKRWLHRIWEAEA